MRDTVEARKHARLALQIPVRVSRKSDSKREDSFFISSLTELSCEGAFVSTTAAYQPGSMLAMEFSLPTTSATAPRNLQVVGQVTRHENAHDHRIGVGVRFIIVSPEEQAFLREFVSGHGPAERKIPSA